MALTEWRAVPHYYETTRPPYSSLAGNRAKLIRFDKQLGRQREYALRLTDLLKRGDSKANVLLQPGDVIIIPESTF